MRKITITLLTAVLVACTAPFATAQDDDKEDDLASLLEDNSAPARKTYVQSTFKATRIVNGHSIENVGKGSLDFRIMHRFGELKDAKNFFGLDGAQTALGFDYGITDGIMIGIFRSTFEKEFLGYTKIKLLRQTEGKGSPVSISYMGSVSAQTLPAPPIPPGTEYHFSNRMFFVNQVLIAHKFSNAFSLQLTPTHIHYNLVPTTAEPNDVIAVGIGGRLKLTNRISLNAEYFYRLPGTELAGYPTATGVQPYTNSLSLGFDIETGGHVFQLMFTNASAMSERAFIGQNVSDWADGEIHFGFNISRVFTIVKPKGFENSRNKIW